jgi:hypothetical protein
MLQQEVLNIDIYDIKSHLTNLPKHSFFITYALSNPAWKKRVATVNNCGAAHKMANYKGKLTRN